MSFITLNSFFYDSMYLFYMFPLCCTRCMFTIFQYLVIMGNYCMIWIFEDRLSFIQSKCLNLASK